MQYIKTLLTLTVPLWGCLNPPNISAQTDTTITLERRYTGQGYALCGSCSPPQNISSQVQLVKKHEAGDHMIISGTIYKEDGVTPDSGITLFLYQADAGGYYHRPKEDVFHPRIFGWVRTEKNGYYEIHSIRPAPEIYAPDKPAHIHVHVFGEGISEHFLHEFWFKGDPFIPAEEMKKYSRLGDFSPVVTLTKGNDGIWRGTRNLRIKTAPPWRYQDD